MPIRESLSGGLAVAPDGILDDDNLRIVSPNWPKRMGGMGADTLVGLDGSDTLVGEVPEINLGGEDGPLTLSGDLLIGGGDADYLLGDLQTLTVDASTGDVALTFGGDTIFDGDYYSLAIGDVESLDIDSHGPDGGDIAIVMGDDTIATVEGDVWGDAYAIDFNGMESGSLSIDFGDDLIASNSSDFESRLYGDAGSIYGYFLGAAEGSVAISAGDDTIAATDNARIYGDFDWVGVYEYETDAAVGATVICGDDLIVGGAGDNWLIGDYMSADGPALTVISGADTFVFTGDFGNDEILDFNPGLDTLRFERYGDMGFDDLAFSTVTGDQGGLLISVADDQGAGTVLLRGIDAIAASDIVFV